MQPTAHLSSVRSRSSARKDPKSVQKMFPGLAGFIKEDIIHKVIRIIQVHECIAHNVKQLSQLTCHLLGLPATARHWDPLQVAAAAGSSSSELGASDSPVPPERISTPQNCWASRSIAGATAQSAGDSSCKGSQHKLLFGAGVVDSTPALRYE